MSVFNVRIFFIECKRRRHAFIQIVEWLYAYFTNNSGIIPGRIVICRRYKIADGIARIVIYVPLAEHCRLFVIWPLIPQKALIFICAQALHLPHIVGKYFCASRFHFKQQSALTGVNRRIAASSVVAHKYGYVVFARFQILGYIYLVIVSVIHCRTSLARSVEYRKHSVYPHIVFGFRRNIRRGNGRSRIEIKVLSERHVGIGYASVSPYPFGRPVRLLKIVKLGNVGQIALVNHLAGRFLRRLVVVAVIIFRRAPGNCRKTRSA